MSRLRLDQYKITVALAKNNMSMKELSAKIGIANKTVYEILAPGKTVNPKTAGRIAEALNVPVEKIIEKAKPVTKRKVKLD